MPGRGVQISLLEGVPLSALEPLKAQLAKHDEPVAVRVVPASPADEIEWLGPASIQIDTYWDTAMLDAMLGNIQEGVAYEDLREALTAAVQRAWRTRSTWFGPYGSIATPVFRLRAFIEAHRSINFTIPGAISEADIASAIESLGDSIPYATDVESDLSHDGMVAGVFVVEMFYVPELAMWMEGSLDADEWDEDEEDAETTF